MTDSTINKPPTEFLDRIDNWLDDYRFELKLTERGNVVSIGDGIVWVKGLPTAQMDEIILFEDGSHGFVFELTKELIGVILLHKTQQITAGHNAYLSQRILDIPVGDNLIGRTLDPLGFPLDGLPQPESQNRAPLERNSPSIIERAAVNQPLYTGNKIIDTLVPIGKGQRQLLIGDEGLGRSTLAIDTVINQRDKNVLCVYVLIGQKRSTIINTIELLRQHGALEYTTVITSQASTLPGLQYLAPFAGCALAEHWMRSGKDTLVVYDDLSTHAKIYRELSLLLRRPPGREAYPGDVFYIHARLLERSTTLNAQAGGGSMTALPIIETEQGEIAAFIPTNLISITDGQIYLNRELFVSGFRPAIDIAKSVSRIGGQAQHPRIKEEAGHMKLDYLQFLELEAFTRFGTRLEARIEKIIQRGHTLRELLKQGHLVPKSIEFQMAWLLAFNDNLFEDIEIKQIPSILNQLERQIAASHLTIDSPRKLWQQTLQEWFHSYSASNTTGNH
ncbi:ATP synthase subunit alpha 1 [Thiosulfatimonas sediminis]|uniref:ATP synthase subunit alpha n=1 Tax=Thiosulfatimonas sediminis TaxID=2675054 RepID=A0A6F8PXP6_9GAMM|nr:F0F1 ATP synthase subunit alpha [Thiosulfatimonas sediminis]BBP46905.1 ATP synthase subunit alpha 1 [Thiosulfatimonas sediminis]